MEYPVSQKVMKLFKYYSDQRYSKTDQEPDYEDIISLIAQQLTDLEANTITDEFANMLRRSQYRNPPPKKFHPTVLGAVIEELEAKNRLFDFSKVVLEPSDIVIARTCSYCGESESNVEGTKYCKKCGKSFDEE
jgi:hypothetical protein